MDNEIELEDLDLELKRTNKLNEVFNRAVRAFDNIQTACYEERQQCLQDRRFCWVAGAMWEDFYTEQLSNKPRLEVNKVQLAVTRINNEYRANRISAVFSPADGSESDETCDNLNSLYRAQRKARGTEFGDNAFMDSITGGIGAWRLRAEYEDEYDEDNEDQLITFEPIFDPETSVYFDLNAKRQDKADAKYCYVVTSMDAQEFEETHKTTPADWPKNDNRFFDWCVNDVVYLAEYYEIEETSETLRFYYGLAGDEIKVTPEEYSDKDYLSELDAKGYKLARNRKIKRQRVHKYIMSGGGILEDCGYIAGRYLPIIITYGKRTYIQNMERASGVIRICKDSQRLLNVQSSKLAEIASGSSIEKPIFTPEQVLGHEARWANDAVSDYPYQLINLSYDINGQLIQPGPVGMTKSPDLPPALGALLQFANDGLNDLMGNQDQAEQVKSNLSGLAVELIQAQISVQTAGYMSNFAIAEKWAAQVWLEMVKDLYTREGRKLKGESEGGSAEQIDIKKPIIDDQTGTVTAINDFSQLKTMDIQIEIGASSESKRAATEKGLIGLMGQIQDPGTQGILSNMILANSSGEGMSELRPYFRKQLIQQGAIEPSKEESDKMAEDAKNQQPEQPSPTDQANVDFLTASAAAEQAKAENLKAQTEKVNKEAEQVEANTQKILSEARINELKAIQAAQQLDINKAMIIDEWLKSQLITGEPAGEVEQPGQEMNEPQPMPMDQGAMMQEPPQ